MKRQKKNVTLILQDQNGSLEILPNRSGHITPLLTEIVSVAKGVQTEKVFECIGASKGTKFVLYRYITTTTKRV